MESSRPRGVDRRTNKLAIKSERRQLVDESMVTVDNQWEDTRRFLTAYANVFFLDIPFHASRSAYTAADEL